MGHQAMRRAFTFPGQGSQTIGMGRELRDSFAAARLVFQEVDDALGEHLSRLIFEGSSEDLTLTQNTQPALMCVSLAAARVLETESGLPVGQLCAFVAGHSLGEYSALAAAGALGIGDAARLLRIRGLAMQKAVPVGEGAMAALLGIEFDLAEAVVSEASRGTEIVTVANDNGVAQVVVSGTRLGVERASQLALQRGAKRAMPLSVSAPFHCPLMQPAADAMAEALDGIKLTTPSVPLIANVTALPVSDPETIRALLVAQVTGVVRWRETVMRLKSEGIEMLVEVGAGKVLSGLAKRIEKDIATMTVGGPADIAAFLKLL